jgi:hypothetical protein
MSNAEFSIGISITRTLDSLLNLLKSVAQQAELDENVSVGVGSSNASRDAIKRSVNLAQLFKGIWIIFM